MKASTKTKKATTDVGGAEGLFGEKKNITGNIGIKHAVRKNTKLLVSSS
jgi:hypothetical protein